MFRRNVVYEVRNLKMGPGDAQAIQDYFIRMQKNDSRFFYVMDMDDEGRLRNVFWADSRSRAAYSYFGDAICFDTTYITNKYDMPFAPFVGVNHHYQSVLLGCALLSSETTRNYIWLFQTWLTCMNGTCFILSGFVHFTLCACPVTLYVCPDYVIC